MSNNTQKQPLLVYTDEVTLSNAVRNYMEKLFEKEQKYIIENLPSSYYMILGTVGSYKNNRPVQIINPCTIPLGDIRKQWVETFLQLKEMNELHNLPYLIYWFDSSETDPYKRVTIESSIDINNNFVPYDECAKRGIQITPNSSSTPGNLLSVDDCIAVLQEFKQAEKNNGIDILSSSSKLCPNCLLCKATKRSESPPPPPPVSSSTTTTATNNPSSSNDDEQATTTVITPTIQEDWSPPGMPIVGERISIYWDLEHEYYNGVVSRILYPAYLISYEDGENHWTILDECKYKKVIGYEEINDGTMSTGDDDDDDDTESTNDDDEWDSSARQGKKISLSSKNQSNTVEHAAGTASSKTQGHVAKNKNICKPAAAAAAAAPSTKTGRYTEDGCIIPAVQPEKDKHGRYRRPKGRPPKNFEWNYRKGYWCPIHDFVTKTNKRKISNKNSLQDEEPSSKVQKKSSDKQKKETVTDASSNVLSVDTQPKQVKKPTLDESVADMDTQDNQSDSLNAEAPDDTPEVQSSGCTIAEIMSSQDQTGRAQKPSIGKENDAVAASSNALSAVTAQLKLVETHTTNDQLGASEPLEEKPISKKPGCSTTAEKYISAQDSTSIKIIEMFISAVEHDKKNEMKWALKKMIKMDDINFDHVPSRLVGSLRKTFCDNEVGKLAKVVLKKLQENYFINLIMEWKVAAVSHQDCDKVLQILTEIKTICMKKTFLVDLGCNTILKYDIEQLLQTTIHLFQDQQNCYPDIIQDVEDLFYANDEETTIIA